KVDAALPGIGSAAGDDEGAGANFGKRSVRALGINHARERQAATGSDADGPGRTGDKGDAAGICHVVGAKDADCAQPADPAAAEGNILRECAIEIQPKG